MNDFYNVGTSKMLGYLALETITGWYKENIDNVKNTLTNQGCFVHIFEKETSAILSGSMI